MKPRITKAVFIYIIFLAFLACKKEKVDSPQTTNAQPVLPINTTEGYGILESGNYYQLGFSDGSKIVEDSLVQWTDFAVVQLYDSITPFSKMTSYGKFGGIVSLNNVILKRNWKPKSDTLITYYDTTGSFYSKPISWNVKGSEKIKGFKYTFNSFPIFDNYKNIFPDEIDRNKDIILNFGYYQADEIVATIGKVYGTTVKKIYYPNTKIVFPVKELRYPGYSFIELQIVLYKNNFKEIDGRVYNFRTRLGILDQYILLK